MPSDLFLLPQGAWRYVKSRLECTLRELLPGGNAIPALRYIGRPVAASPGTLHSVPCGRSPLFFIFAIALAVLQSWLTGMLCVCSNGFGGDS